MGFFDSLRVRMQNRTRDKPTEPNYSIMTSARRNRADYTLSSSEAIYAAVSRISNTIAALPLHLYKGEEIQTGHDLERLVAYAPNPCMTPFVFRQTMEASRNTEGTAYALIVPDETTGRPVALDVLDATRVTPMRDLETREIWYQLAFDNGKTATVHHSSMIVLRHMSASGEKGIRPIDVLRGTLSYDQDIKEFSARQLEGVNSGVVLNIPGTGLNEARKKTIIKAPPHNIPHRSAVAFPQSPTCRNLDVPPVLLRFLQVESCKNATRCPARELCGVALSAVLPIFFLLCLFHPVILYSKRVSAASLAHSFFLALLLIFVQQPLR